MRRRFEYRTATAEEITAEASALEGRSIASIAATLGRLVDLETITKGTVGAVIEAYFGIEPNARPEADFVGAGIELKSVPLIAREDGSLRIKERTFVTMIDYVRLAAEEWSGASVVRKLRRILFVFYRWDPELRGPSARIERVHLWSPSDEELTLFQHDWTVVRDKARASRAEEISEADGLVLGASTKGANALSVRRQANTDVRAKQRAWALKPAFTQALFDSLVSPMATAPDGTDLDDFDAFEGSVLAKLRAIRRQSIYEISDRLGLPRSKAKDFHAQVIARAIGATRRKKVPDEFARFGIENKVTRVSPQGRPYEAMSFPAFDYFDIDDEVWEDSDLLRRLERLLIVPLVAPTKSTPLGQARVGGAFFWSPDASQLEVIRREWEMFRGEIRAGLADRLTPASQTKVIHVRPHGRVRSDTKDAPGIGPVTKKAFWLNLGFVEQLVVAHPRWDGS